MFLNRAFGDNAYFNGSFLLFAFFLFPPLVLPQHRETPSFFRLARREKLLHDVSPLVCADFSAWLRQNNFEIAHHGSPNKLGFPKGFTQSLCPRPPLAAGGNRTPGQLHKEFVPSLGYFLTRI